MYERMKIQVKADPFLKYIELTCRVIQICVLFGSIRDVED